MHKELAKIRSTMLGIEDHGIFTTMLYVDYEEGTSQGIGGYSLDGPRKDDSDKFLGRFGTAEGCQWIMNTLTAVGVDSWEKLVGRQIWVYRESDRFGAKPIGIQGLSTEGGAKEPFMFAELWGQA